MVRDPRRLETICSSKFLGAMALMLTVGCAAVPAPAPTGLSSPLARAKVFLSAADYRRAIESCQEELAVRPSAASYVYVTYVYHALDAYIDSLARDDRWVQVEQLARSLSSQRPDEMLEQPDVLARIAKELIQDAARRQADVAAGMATRLNESEADALWGQQKRWRDQRPNGWWLSIPPEWNWDGLGLEVR